MLTPSQHSLLHRIALLLIRLSLGAYLFFAGYNKAFKMGATLGESAKAWMANGYNPKVPAWLPGFIATPYGYAIPWLEMLCGLLLVLGMFFRSSAAATTFLLASIAVAVVADAGSISGSDRLGVHHSIVMACVAFLLIFTGPGGFSIDALLPKGRRKR